VLYLVDQLFVKVEQVAQEPDREQQVLLPVRQVLGGALGVVEPAAEVGDVVP